MGPIVIGMQFLTSAFLLPYLASRTSENASTPIEKEDIAGSFQATVGERKPLGPLLGTVGTGSIFWGLYARQAEFGVGWNERYSSFVDLLSIDRVGSSFLVDLAILYLVCFNVGSLMLIYSVVV